MTLAISAMSFAAAETGRQFYFEDAELGDLNYEWLNVSSCHVKANSINGGTGPVSLVCASSTSGSRVTKASFKVNGNLVLTYDTYITGSKSSDDVTLIAKSISTVSYVEFENANVHALDGDLSINGLYYDNGDHSYCPIKNTDLFAEKGSVALTCCKMDGGSISASNVDISYSTVTINNLSAKTVNINEDGVLNIGNVSRDLNLADACRVEVGEIIVGDKASLGINGATLVFHEGSSITLLEGATLTAFDNVNFEFIVDADSITDDGVAYSFDVFKGMTDEGNLALIEGFEDAVAAGEIGITLKGMTAEGELIDLDAGSADVTFKNGTLSISSSGSVPEPTTATLSLLALAALAARRRRK